MPGGAATTSRPGKAGAGPGRASPSRPGHVRHHPCSAFRRRERRDRYAASRSSGRGPPRSPDRNASTAAMRRRLSRRSTRAPPGRAKRSHGRRSAKASPTIWRGSRVRVAASKGPATRVMPSPRFENVLAAKSFAYSRPNPTGRLMPRSSSCTALSKIADEEGGRVRGRGWARQGRRRRNGPGWVPVLGGPSGSLFPRCFTRMGAKRRSELATRRDRPVSGFEV